VHPGAHGADDHVALRPRERLASGLRIHAERVAGSAVDRLRLAGVRATPLILQGKPAITIESGYLASTDEASIARIEQAVAGVMRWLGMRPSGPAPVQHVVWIDRNEVLRSDVTGIFQPAVERGQTVAEGTLIGRITDFHGTRLSEVRSPFAGEVLYVIGTPPVTKGEPVAFIGQGVP